MGDKQQTPAQIQPAVQPVGAEQSNNASTKGMSDTKAPAIANAEALITEIEGGTRAFMLYKVEDALKVLDSSSVTGAADTARRLRKVAADNGLFNDHNVRFAREYLDRHIQGKERSFERNGETALKHMVNVDLILRVSKSAEHQTLHDELEAIWKFYNSIERGTYGEDLVALAERIQSFMKAGHQIGPAMWAQTSVQMSTLDKWYLTPFAGKRGVQGCTIFQGFLEAYNGWLAIKTQLEDTSYEDVSTGDSKSEIESKASGATVPEYEKKDYKRTERDCKLAIDNAKRVINGLSGSRHREYSPADCHEAIVWLKQMQPHMSYDQSQEAPGLIHSLEVLFEETPDPDTGKGPSASGGVNLDISKPFGVGALKTALNTIANDPGEEGRLSFSGDIQARIGNGLFSGYVGALLDLSIGYGVADTATCTLSFDAAAAVKAGISFAGIASAGVEAGAGYNIAARFPNPGSAAEWLYVQLAAIDEKLGGGILGTNQDVTPSVDPTVVEETRGTAAGQVTAGVANAAVNGEVRGTKGTAGFSQNGKDLVDDKGQALERKTTVSTVTAGGSYRAPGGWGIDGSYTFTSEEIQGDANAANDGNYRNHNVDIGISLGKVINSTKPISEALPSKDIQDGILNLFAQFESKLPSGGISRDVLNNVFDKVVAEIYDAARTGRENNMNARVSVGLTWQSVYEAAAKDYKNQYFRISVNPSFSRSIEMDGGVVSGSAEVSAAGSVVVLEDLGSDTLTYIQQRREFRWNDKQWTDMVNNDRQAFQEVTDNLLNPDHHLYAAAFKKFANQEGYPGGGFSAALKALERYLDSLPRSTRGKTK